MNPRRTSKIDTFLNIFDAYPREYFILIFFGVFLLAIIWTTFSLTVLHHGYYQALADKQQIASQQLPVTRGSIYSGTGSGTTLATSVDLNDLAIDPQIEGDKGKLAQFLTDVIYDEMCGITHRETCKEDLIRFLRVLDIPDFQYSESYVRDKILTQVTRKISQDKVTSVLLRDKLSSEEIQIITSWGISGVYAQENGLYVNPEELSRSESFADLYTQLFWGAPEDVLYQVRQRDLRYIAMYQKLSILASDKITQFIADENQAISQGWISQAESIGGFIILSPRQQRVYPERSVASQILWFLDNSGEGHYGIEGYFDELLRWNPGSNQRKKDIQWRTIDPIDFSEKDISLLEGVDVHTTIDRNVQKRVEELLEEWVIKYGANKGTVIVMQPHTGKILAMANYPNFDPNNPGEVYELKQVTYADYPNPATDLLGKAVFVEDIENGTKYYYDGREIFLREAEREEYTDTSMKKYIFKNEFWAWVYQNDAISSLYEPGSIMKTITVAVGIDSWEIRPNDRYNDEGQVEIAGFTIRNVSKECLGYNTYTHALSYSCNVGMIRIAQKLWKALFHQYQLDFGFGEKTNISLEWEITGRVEPYEKWPTSKLLTNSYGLWVSATPLQMAAAYSTIANGGVYMKPYIVDKITYPDGQEVVFEPQPLRRVIKESTADIVTQMLVEWVDSWVAKTWAVEGFTIAGKTGTSQIAYKGGYEEGEASTNGSYAGFAPAENPQFVIVVKLERPRKSVYGGATSSYIFGQIAAELFDYYAIPKKITEE